MPTVEAIEDALRDIDFEGVFEKINLYIELEDLRAQVAAKDKRIAQLTRRVEIRDRTVRRLRRMNKRHCDLMTKAGLYVRHRPTDLVDRIIAAKGGITEPDEGWNALGGSFDSDSGGWLADC